MVDTTTTTTTGPVKELPVSNDFLTGFADLFKNLQGSKVKTTGTSGTPTALGGVDATIQQLLQSIMSGEFSKDAAGRDTEAAVNGIFTQFKDQVLPQIYQAQNNSGGYNSTTGQLLANDAFSRTVSQAASLKLKTATDYANAQTQTAQAITNAAGTSAKLVENKTQATSPTTSIKGNGLGASASIIGTAAKLAPILFPNQAKGAAVKKNPKQEELPDPETAQIPGNRDATGVDVNSVPGTTGDVSPTTIGGGNPSAESFPLPDAGTGIETQVLEPTNFSSLFDSATSQYLSASGLSDVSGVTDIFGGVTESVGGVGEAVDLTAEGILSGGGFGDLAPEFADSIGLTSIGGEVAGEVGADIVGSLGTDIALEAGGEALAGEALGSLVAEEAGGLALEELLAFFFI